MLDAVAAAGIEGFAYRAELITLAEEAELLRALAQLPFQEARFQQYTARRRSVAYGASYDYGAGDLVPAPVIPEFLFGVRAKVSAWTAVPSEAFAYALINEYRPGTPLGWHRDRGEFGVVAGVSLGTPARMRFRRYPPGKREKALSLELAPRSAYFMQGAARWSWQHSVPPTPGLRYSITFRTLRASV